MTLTQLASSVNVREDERPDMRVFTARLADGQTYGIGFDLHIAPDRARKRALRAIGKRVWMLAGMPPLTHD